MKYILSLIVLVVLCCINMPVFQFGFTEFAFYLLALYIVVYPKDIEFDKNRAGNLIIKKWKVTKGFWIGIAAFFIYIFVLPFLLSSPIFHNQAYRNLIGKVEKSNDISKQIAPIDVDEIRTVDEETAEILGDKVLGNQTALGSQVVIGEYSIQKVNGKLFWVAPLLHSGFFKWLQSNKDMSGYIMVSATNERDVRLVQNVKNINIELKYQPNAFLFENLKRHIYINGYFNVGLTDYSFEINDEGMPFWVVSIYKKEVGFSGDNANKVLTVNAQTGDIKDYSITDAPLWIDRIQPYYYIQEQLNDWGEYVHGYWNFSNQDKLTTTEEPSLVYGNDHNSYWYTGLKSVGKDNSIVGFTLTNTRTKKTTFYKQSGASENAAQSSAEGKVQEKGYKASSPIPYNINGIPTYIMSLKDNGGLVKMFAMVAVGDYSIVGVGNTPNEALLSFKNVYYSNGNNRMDVNNTTKKIKLMGSITRMNTDVRNGNSYYYFTLAESAKVFISTSNISSDLPISQAGDKVEVEFIEDKANLIDISSFKNLQLNTK